MKEFGDIKLNISVDGIRNQYTYVRYPSRWEEWENKLQFTRREGIPFTLFFTPSCHSIFGLTDFLNWTKENIGGLESVQPIALYEPDFLCISQLPKNAKLALMKKLNNYIAQCPESHRIIFPVINQMISAEALDQNIELCIDYTKAKDNLRKVDSRKLIPEFWEFYS